MTNEILVDSDELCLEIKVIDNGNYCTRQGECPNQCYEIIAEYKNQSLPSCLYHNPTLEKFGSHMIDRLREQDFEIPRELIEYTKS